MARRRNPATALLGLFEAETPLAPALKRCRALGVPEQSLQVLSTLPLAERLGHRPQPIPLHRWTLGGGALGLVLGVALAAGTALLYPLKTGGLPIVAPPVVGLIAFEGMMLMAILFTFFSMVWTIRQDTGAESHPSIHEGMIGLAIVSGDGLPPLGMLRQALLQSGAREVVRQT